MNKVVINVFRIRRDLKYITVPEKVYPDMKPLHIKQEIEETLKPNSTFYTKGIPRSVFLTHLNHA